MNVLWDFDDSQMHESIFGQDNPWNKSTAPSRFEKVGWDGYAMAYKIAADRLVDGLQWGPISELYYAFPIMFLYQIARRRGFHSHQPGCYTVGGNYRTVMTSAMPTSHLPTPNLRVLELVSRIPGPQLREAARLPRSARVIKANRSPGRGRDAGGRH